MKKNANGFQCRGERGSALLIVLGFLSFMIISAVAFAIYMRIERQASSNYRHASTARHLLNSALYRAMDEIDSELRAENMPLAVNSNSSGKNNRKFPTWPGRVRTSAVVNSLDNGGNARVLSLDALSYVPGILLNDVRYYAVRPYNALVTYPGAKWRSISMPLSTMDGMNAAGSAVLGRYAYVCINVSDMLNVNNCKALVRDAAENRISIGHLFETDEERTKFDERVELDIGYETLQDFYACMYNMDNLKLYSPWHDYLDSAAPNPDLIPFNKASKHILIADGIVKAEPVDNPAPYNISKDPPIRAADLANLQPVPDLTFQGNFAVTLNKALLGNMLPGASASINTVLPMLLCDYIDEDNVPCALNMPCVELAPMISQISVPALAPAFITTRDSGTVNAAGDPITIYTLDLTALATSEINVEVMWPFKNTSNRTSPDNYVIEVKAYLKVHKTHSPQRADSFQAPPLRADNYLVELDGSKNVPSFNSDITDQDQACLAVPVTLTGNFDAPNGGPGTPGTPSGSLKLDLCDSEGATYNGFTMGAQLSVSLVLGYVRIKNSANSKYVDCVPTMLKYPQHNNISELTEYAAVDKLFFQTGPSIPLADTMVVTRPLSDLNYEWFCLETPDPRFNWKTSNWIKSDVNEADGRLNTSTKGIFALNDGRDSDIFMAVSNAGKLQSPGELGYLVRPFPYEVAGNPVDFRTHTDPANCQDYKYMFRTIRLFDHGDPSDTINRKHDDIYNNFIAANADKSLIGARVNPLSDIPLVLGAAVERIPLDYWIANKITEAVQSGSTPPAALLKANYSDLLAGNTWVNFTNGWTLCLNNVRKVTDINTDYSSNLKDEYCADKYFGWFAGVNPDKVFNASGFTDPNGVPANLSISLHEVDREMLYSFTLDSFSDRQQLFLYIISAEATAAAFGDQVSSLAGGKAIALVWRDPYPIGFEAGAVVQPSRMYTDLDRISPWHQNYRGVDDDDYEYFDNDRDNLLRERGAHETKILFFKYLDN